MDSEEPAVKKLKLMEESHVAAESNNGGRQGAEDDEMLIVEASSPPAASAEVDDLAGTSSLGDDHPLSPASSSGATSREEEEEEKSPESTPEKVHPGGTSLEDLKWKTPVTSLPPVEASPDHFVCYKLPWTEAKAPEPRNRPFSLNQDRIWLPFADKHSNEGHWAEVKKVLGAKISNCRDLADAIQRCSRRDLNCNLLLEFFCGRRDSSYEEDETKEFFDRILPELQQLALALPDLLPQPAIPILKAGQSISLSQLQVASILANAFFCTFPERRRKTCGLPAINFQGLYHLPKGDQSLVDSNMEKLKCLITYFRRIDLQNQRPFGVVTYHWREVPQSPAWDESSKPILGLHVSHSGTIEDDGQYMLQVDFANKFLGGGVLSQGCVQEEIRFAICPELIAGCLFSRVMEDNEAIVICGAEQFNRYKGYGSTFQWAGSHMDLTPRDPDGRRCVSVVAVDAIPFYGRRHRQFDISCIDRELTKAFVGFRVDPGSPAVPVASGNWGCGVFGGDPKLKSVLQLLAASQSGRALVYFTFRDKTLIGPLTDLHALLLLRKATVGEVYRTLIEFRYKKGADVISFLRSRLGKTSLITDFAKREIKKEEENEAIAEKKEKGIPRVEVKEEKPQVGQEKNPVETNKKSGNKVQCKITNFMKR